jgi:hypothetical protein
MGRQFLPPEEADSWGEYRARLETEAGARVNPWRPLWWGLDGLSAFFLCIYAVQDHYWWLWLALCTLLAINGSIALRAMDRADRKRARATELSQLETAWLSHLDRRSPTM